MRFTDHALWRLYERFDRTREDIGYMTSSLEMFTKAMIWMCPVTEIRKQLIKYPETKYYYNDEYRMCLAVGDNDDVITVLNC